MFTSQLSSLLCVLSIGLTSAHEVATHHNITSTAIRYIYNNLPSDAAALRGCLNTIEELVQEGTGQEDLDPGNRFMFHFYPALHGRLDAFITVDASCSSREWGFAGDNLFPNGASLVCTHNFTRRDANTKQDNISGSLINDHTWSAAINDARSSDPTTRKRGWRHLGYVLHLLQDLTSPAHVRSDPHPHYWLFPGESDPIEVLDGRIPGTPSSHGTSPFIDVESPLQLFDELQSWTQVNFWSKDSIELPERARFPGPTPVAVERGYYKDSRGRRIARLGVLAYTESAVLDPANDWPIFYRNFADATIDGVVADEQWNELGPQAVLYTASLIVKFWKDAGWNLPCADRESCFRMVGTATTVSGRGATKVVPGDTIRLTVRLDPASVMTPADLLQPWPTTGPSVVYYFANPQSNTEITLGATTYRSSDAMVPPTPVTVGWGAMDAATYGVVSPVMVPAGKEHNPIALLDFANMLVPTFLLEYSGDFNQLQKSPLPPLLGFTAESQNSVFNIQALDGSVIKGKTAGIERCQ